jgi:hypothetical protein
MRPGFEKPDAGFVDRIIHAEIPGTAADTNLQKPRNCIGNLKRRGEGVKKLSSCWLAAKPRCFSGIRAVRPGLGLKGWHARSSQLEKGQFILQSAQEILFFGNA